MTVARAELWLYRLEQQHPGSGQKRDPSGGSECESEFHDEDLGEKIDYGEQNANSGYFLDEWQVPIDPTYLGGE